MKNRYGLEYTSSEYLYHIILPDDFRKNNKIKLKKAVYSTLLNIDNISLDVIKKDYQLNETLKKYSDAVANDNGVVFKWISPNGQ
jgi:hypothetical protein